MIDQLKEMESVRQQMKREGFEAHCINADFPFSLALSNGVYCHPITKMAYEMWLAGRESVLAGRLNKQMPTSQHTSILHDIDCYFDNANNTKRNADNLIQDIYEHLTEEAKANTVPKGFVLMPIEATDEIAEAIAFSANCCGGIADDIYQAILQTVQKQLPNDQASEKPQSNAFLSVDCGAPLPNVVNTDVSDLNGSNSTQLDWNQAPEWANWWSADDLGFCWWSLEPKFISESWHFAGGYAEVAISPKFNYQGDWCNSLRKRPLTLQPQSLENYRE